MILKMCELFYVKVLLYLIHETSYFINKLDLIIKFCKKKIYSWNLYKILLVSKINKFVSSKSRVVTHPIFDQHST